MKIERSVVSLSTSFLEEAAAITKSADLRPGQIRKRLVRMGIVLGGGLLGVIVAGALIAIGVPQGDPARLVTLFLLFAAAIVACSSIVGMGIVLSGAAVYLYVQNLAATREKYESIDQTTVLVQAVTEIELDRLFEEELAEIYAAIALRVARNAAAPGDVYRPLYRAIHAYFWRRAPFVDPDFQVAGHSEQNKLRSKGTI